MIRFLLVLLLLAACGPLPQGRCTPYEQRCDLLGVDGQQVTQICTSDSTWSDVERCDGLCVVENGRPTCEMDE